LPAHRFRTATPEGNVTPTLRQACLSLLLLALFTPAVPARSALAAANDPTIRRATSMGAVGVGEHVSEVMARQAQEDAAGVRRERDAEEKERPRPDRGRLPLNPASPLVSGTLDALGRSAAPAGDLGAMSSQTLGVSWTAATLSGVNPTSSFPPDCMGAVGPTQYVVFVNGRLVTFNKNTGIADGALNANADVFFNSVRGGSYTSDPRIRYDRNTGRWFLVIINTSTPNRILLAVSDAASAGVITGSTVFTYFFIPIDTTPPAISNTCFADYPTLGLDANALYIGSNNFCGAAGSYTGTDGYVVRKTSILGAGPIVVTAFRGLVPSASAAGPYTPQGVDNLDPASTEGYFIGVDNASYGTLQLRRVSNPGGTPTISANIPISVPATGSPMNSPHLGNTRGTTGYLDGLDDRLYAAHIRNGQLWTAHAIGVNNTGVASGTLTRDGSRWYQLSVPAGSGTPTLVQSGTVYTPSATNLADQRNYWIPSIMVSGQGHAAMSLAAAGTNERANAATAGRFASDAGGAMQAPVLITNSATAYNPPSDPGSAGYGRRWGDYTYVSLDPLDDMTMYAVSEFCDATNSYGVRVTKLVAPPPATPAALADITAGQGTVTLTLTGTSVTGSGFYDPGASPPGVPAFSHLSASITAGGATGTPPALVSATYLSPTTLSLVLDATAATANVGSERYTITVTNPDGQVAAAPVVHVTDGGPATVSLAGNISAAEGNSGTKVFGFSAALSTAQPVPVTVRFQTSDGTATVADNDYAAAVDSVVLAAGQLAGTIRVYVNGDTKYEPSETFGVTITSASGVALGTVVSATATILNDDAVPAVSIAASAATTEGDNRSHALSFPVTLTNASSGAVSVNWTTADNTATTADNDYTAGSGTLVIPAGATSDTLRVSVTGDTKYENNEAFSVTLSSPSGATLGNAIATGTIMNDDVMPDLSIDAVQHLEGNNGTTPFHFTVSLSQASGVLTVVDWATADWTATAATGDYAAASGTLTFPPGVTSQGLDVLVNGDTVQEPDEMFALQLSNPVSATIAAGNGVGTILNDDGAPVLAIGDVTALEGTGGLTPFRFVVSLSSPSQVPVGVQYQTVDASATLANADYVPASGTLTFAPLAISDTITVQVVADACGETDEVFEVTLSNATGATIADPLGMGIIQNDDDVVPPVVAVLQPNGGEVFGVGGVATLQWSATDSAGVNTVDLLLSRDAGVTYPDVIAAGIPNSGTYFWTVTAPVTGSALLQVRAHDTGCNTGSDASDAVFAIDEHVTGVPDGGPVTVFALGPVQPNPSRGAIQFTYQLPRESPVRLSIVDVQGRELAVLANGPVGAGRHPATWSGVMPGGQAAHGLYFVRYVAGGKVFSRRFALLH
jgi:hypothetical protein